MSKYKEVSINDIAREIGVNEIDFRRLLMGIGFAEIMNEAGRYAAIESWDKKEEPSGHPTLKNVEKVVREYMGEAIKDGHIKMS